MLLWLWLYGPPLRQTHAMALFLVAPQAEPLWLTTARVMSSGSILGLVSAELVRVRAAWGQAAAQSASCMGRPVPQTHGRAFLLALLRRRTRTLPAPAWRQLCPPGEGREGSARVFGHPTGPPGCRTWGSVPAPPSPPSTPLRAAHESAGAFLGQEGTCALQGRAAASPPLAPTPGAGAAQLQAETCLSNYRGDKTFRGFAFLPSHTWERTFPISQFLRNNFPPAWPSPGSPVGSGGSRQPRLGLVVGAADSPVPPPAAPRAPTGSREGWCLSSLCWVQGTSVSPHNWGLTACPRGVLVTGSWGGLHRRPKETGASRVTSQALHLHFSWER